jgi:hypothetical protein
MTQKYDMRTVYPMVQTQQPLVTKTIFDEHIQPHSSQYVASTHFGGIRPELLVPKPSGQAGCLSRGGYSLERHLNWEATEYTNVQVS